ncbi:MAG: hypothetical protein Crog4KO_32660 [Crocinitomicaceae bacterium]
MQAVDSTQEVRPKRPVFLLVLCILSFISIGIGFVEGGMALISGPDSPEQMEASIAVLDKQIAGLDDQQMSDWKPTFEKLKNLVIVLNDKFYAYAALGLFIHAIGLGAVIMMLKGRKIGFHFYIIYTLLSIGDYYFFISPAMIPTIVIVFSALLGALFVSLYAVNLKWMR